MNIRVRDAEKGILNKKTGFDEGASEEVEGYGKGEMGHSITLGWQPSCDCGVCTDEDLGGEMVTSHAPEPVPAVVLDPFAGAGTTMLVAAKLGRDSIGIELKGEYCEMARRRIEKGLGFLAQTEVT